MKAKPSYITVEDLNVSGMRKNRHLSKAVALQKFYEFRIKLQPKCHEKGIERSVADRGYPYSELCRHGGMITKDLTLSDRIYKWNCGYMEDRELHAVLNLKDAPTCEIA